MSLTSVSPVMATAYANGDGASPGYPPHQRNLHDQLEAFRRSDSARDTLLQRLMDDNTRLQREVREARDDYDNEKMSRRQWQSESEKTRMELEQIRSTGNNDAFALALIDGDGCIFQDDLLHAVGEGGAEAAHMLNSEIKQHLQDRCGAAASRTTLVVHIYANFEDLSRKLAAVGLLNTAGDFGTFARSFSFNQPLFNFIDVGRGKERADHKIKEMFRLFVNNTHCKQIIFGGTHDNGYLLNLEPLRRDPSIASRITLLETTEAEWQYKNLGFPVVRFDSVFRSRPLPEGRGAFISNFHGYQPGSGGQHGPISPPASNRAAPPPSSLSSIQPPTPTTATNVTANTPLPTPPAPTNGTQSPAAAIKSPSPGPKTSSYAAVGGQSESKNINIAPAKEARARRYALFNGDNDRIDVKLPRATGESEMRYNMRVKGTGKCCNNYHLRSYCKSGANCGYSHEPLLPKELRLVLAHKARTSVCPRGSKCTDVLCYLGHQCPQDNCQRSDCFFGDLHGLDTEPKLKVFEDDEIEILS